MKSNKGREFTFGDSVLVHKVKHTYIFVPNLSKRATDTGTYEMITIETRWYPREIQILVSTYVLGQDLPKFIFSCVCVGGGGYSGQVKTEKSQSVKICLNFNWQGGGVILGKSKLKSLFWASQN